MQVDKYEQDLITTPPNLCFTEKHLDYFRELLPVQIFKNLRNFTLIVEVKYADKVNITRLFTP